MTDADVIVIGGGAAGMMASYFAASEGASVLLLDKNRQLGRKLRITGKGRCNLTSNCDRREFLENISGDSRFLYSAVSSFLPQDVMAFFEEHRVPLKTERGKRVFPQSDNANDIADCLASLCRSSGVRVMRTAAAQRWCPFSSMYPSGRIFSTISGSLSSWDLHSFFAVRISCS